MMSTTTPTTAKPPTLIPVQERDPVRFSAYTSMPTPHDDMANESTFTPEQIARFKSGSVDDTVLPSAGAVMAAAHECLHWYQRPLAALLLRNPFARPKTAPAPVITAEEMARFKALNGKSQGPRVDRDEVIDAIASDVYDSSDR